MKRTFTPLCKVSAQRTAYLLSLLVIFSSPLLVPLSVVAQVTQGFSTKNNASAISPATSAKPSAAAETLPAWAWAAVAGEGAGLSIAADHLGNSYLTGLLGTNTLIKYNAAGQLQWAQKAGEIGRGVAVDKEGNSYLLADFSGTTTIGNYTFEGGGIFLAKYNPSGQLAWASKVSSNSNANSITVDGNGNSYILAEAGQGTTIGTTYFPKSADFVAKYSSTGQLLWASNLGIQNTSYGYNNLATDAAGNNYTIGSFMGSVTFGNTTLTSSGQTDAFLLKHNTQGQVVWAKKIIGTSDMDYGDGVTVDTQGNIYVTANAGNPAGGSSRVYYVAKYNANGQQTWIKAAGNAATGVGTDTNGNVYIAGSMDETQYDENQNADMSIIQYDAAGQVKFEQKSGGQSYKFPYAFAVDRTGNCYLTGEFSGNDRQPGTLVFGSTTITGVMGGGTGMSFYAKLGTATPQAEPLLVSAGPNQTVYYGYSPAACATLTAQNASGGTPGYTYTWSTGQTGPSIQVCPRVTTVYTLTIKDAVGRTYSDQVQVAVEDVSCGNNPQNPKVLLCYNPSGKPGKEQTLCVAASAVKAHLAKGATLGTCTSGADATATLASTEYSIQAYPNPVEDYLTIDIKGMQNTLAEVTLFDQVGTEKYRLQLPISNTKFTMDMRQVPIKTGVYYVRINTASGSQTIRMVKK